MAMTLQGVSSLAFVVCSSRRSNSVSKSNRSYLVYPLRTTRRKLSVKPSDVPLYVPLDLTKDIIRLLLVNPGQGSEDIICSLKEVSLDNIHPNYTALSYTWGSPIRRSASLWTFRGMYQYLREWIERTLPHTPTILIDGKRVPVTPNVESALLHLRNPDTPLLIWVDAVCIDQDNSQEKAHEVDLMRRIYTQAEKTYVWLGPAADESDKAIDFIIASDSIDVMDPKFKLDSISPPWPALQALFARSWWSRIWVIQEAFLSKNLIIKCGDKETTMDHFARLATKENMIRRRLRTDPSFGGFYAHTARWTFIPPTTPFYTLLGGWFDMRKMKSSDSSMSLPLWEILLSTNPFSSSLPRDKIYGLLGLCVDSDRKAINIDYTTRYSDREVFKETLVHVIRSRNHIQPLQFVQSGRKKLDSLPSWVPDLSSVGFQLAMSFTNVGYSAATDNSKWIRLNHPILGPLVLDHPVLTTLSHRLLPGLAGITARRLVDSRGSAPSFSDNNNILTLRGIPFDSVTYADPAPDIGIFQASDSVYLDHQRVYLISDMIPFLKRWEREVALHPQNPYLTREGRYNAYWRTLISNRYRGADATKHGGHTLPPANYNIAYEVWMGRRSLPRDASERSNLLLQVGTFQGMAGRVATNRAFIITTMGFLGMAPDATEKGDLVCVLQGGEVPFVIRHKGDDQWELIGECYIHGIMNGKVVNNAKSEDVRKFNLI